MTYEEVLDAVLSLSDADKQKLIAEVEQIMQKPATKAKPKDQHGILDIPPLSLGEWPESLGTLRREDIYGDDGR